MVLLISNFSGFMIQKGHFMITNIIEVLLELQQKNHLPHT